MIKLQLTKDSTRGSLTTLPVGRLPGGYRLQVIYGEDALEIEPEKSPERPSALQGAFTSPHADISGDVIGGTDWLFLRDDGVAVFDGTLTFKATFVSDPNKAHVFDAVLSGQASLKNLRDDDGNVVPVRPVVGAEDLKCLTGTLPVALPIQFDTSATAPAGASVDIKKAAANGGPFADLALRQYIARGFITFDEGKVSGVDLKILDTTDLLEAEAVKAELNGKKHTLYAASQSGSHDTEDPFERMIRLAGDNENEWKTYRTVFTSEVVAHLTKKIPKLQFLTALRGLEFDAALPLLELAQQTIADHYSKLQPSGEAHHVAE